MGAFLGKLGELFSGGAKDVIKEVRGILDDNITNKEELKTLEIAMEELLTKRLSMLQESAHKILELEVSDRNSARSREVEYVKALHRPDWLMILSGLVGLGSYIYMLVTLSRVTVPDPNRELFIHALGIVEGVAITIFSYYFGSSRGSAIKDVAKRADDSARK
jgi:hypothetical protein